MEFLTAEDKYIAEFSVRTEELLASRKAIETSKLIALKDLHKLDEIYLYTLAGGAQEDEGALPVSFTGLFLDNAIPTPLRRIALNDYPPEAEKVCLFDSDLNVIRWTDGATITRIHRQKTVSVLREIHQTFGEVYFYGWLLNDQVRASSQAAKDEIAAKRLAAKESMREFMKKNLGDQS